MKQVLIVDDNKAVCGFISRVIKAKFIDEVFIAHNGEEALVTVKENKIELVILDIAMPIMDGIQFLEKVRADNLLENVPILVLSGQNDRDTVASAIKHNVTEYILKPLSYEETYDKLKGYLTLI